MVLGLINFLLGGKKKTKVSKAGQVGIPGNGSNQGQFQQMPNNNSMPQQGNPQQQQNPQGNPQQNAEHHHHHHNGENPQQQNPPMDHTSQPQSQGMNVPKGSGSQIITKIYDELKTTNERIGEIVTDVRKIQTDVNSLGHRIDNLEEEKKVSDEKLGDINTNMSKFLSLYELINNQYNPFVDGDGKKMVEVSANGNSLNDLDPNSPAIPQIDLSKLPVDALKDLNTSNSNNNNDSLESSLLELDTLNIEEAAVDAVPLTKLKNNTNSLVIILSWLEYLIKKVGIEETRNSLRYYTETLRWITPEVFFDLDKYLRGMKDKNEITDDLKLNVKDHIVSLYFISKLNEKTLDAKLTAAVLQIIKQ